MKQLFKDISIIAVLFTTAFFLSGCQGAGTKNLRIIVTTDVHGNIFSQDMVTGEITRASMSKVSSYINSEWSGEKLILDNGDNLQGSPSVYYYNFVDTVSPHIWAEVLNYLGCDAITVGNHDIEAGHPVYDRIRNEYVFPMLAANAVSIETGEPYFEPYTIIRKGGLRIAVLGLITPGVPGWLPEILYRGIRFEDMVESAGKWMPEILKEEPDIIVGLFHAGWDENYGTGTTGSSLNENASLAVARQVPGFDIVFIGHDHDIKVENLINIEGDSVVVIDGGSHARAVSVADITLTGSGKSRNITINGFIVRTDSLLPDNYYDEHFSSDYIAVRDYVNREIGTLENSISSRDSYFGDSPFIDLIHTVQLQTSGADISFAAPMSFDVSIEEGKVLVSDMFDLYRYENMLYTIELYGNEIDSYLEYSYGMWTGHMKSRADRLLKYDQSREGLQLENRYYNFDSAEGIRYTVDVSRPAGDKVTIEEMSDGSPFDTEAKYKVALNSYRGSGGGGHLTIGCGLSDDEIRQRLVKSTEKDLRYYMISWIEERGNIEIECNQNWSFIPAQWVKEAMEREYKILFNR